MSDKQQFYPVAQVVCDHLGQLFLRSVVLELIYGQVSNMPQRPFLKKKADSMAEAKKRFPHLQGTCKWFVISLNDQTYFAAGPHDFFDVFLFPTAVVSTKPKSQLLSLSFTPDHPSAPTPSLPQDPNSSVDPPTPSSPSIAPNIKNPPGLASVNDTNQRIGPDQPSDTSPPPLSCTVTGLEGLNCQVI